jgi:PASTA domain/HAAS
MMPAQQSPRSDAISDFVQRVERACADLPSVQRRGILADLDAHLREMGERSDLLTELGDPDQYARDLRAAMNLPTSRPLARAPRRWWPAAIALVVAAVAIGTVLAVRAATSSERPRQPSPSATTSPATPRLIQAPSLVGLTQAVAANRVASLGLTVRVQYVRSSALPRGTVVIQSPAAFSRMPPGATITLQLSPGR